MNERPAILPLQRPEYVAAPEMLLSELAWQGIEPARDGNLPMGFVYAGEPRSLKSVEFTRTRPGLDRASIDNWSAALVSAGFETDGQATIMARGVADALEGVVAPRAKGRAATPLTPAIGRLQNGRGMAGKANPFNVAASLETMYRLGGGDGTLLAGWQAAANGLVARDPAIRALDRAVREALEPATEPAATSAPSPRPSVDLGTSSTPFGWMADAWTQLVGPWADVLPARRWVDWATTVLRMGLGMGYAWEASWHDRLARTALSEGNAGDTDWNDLLPSGPLLPWSPSAEKVSVRDVSAHLRGLLARGSAVRTLLVDLLEAEEGLADKPLAGPDSVLERLSRPDQRDALLGALSASNGGLLHEAVRYALRIRATSGDGVDHYGMLEQRGTRWLVPIPATEWIVVIASLACDGPGEQTTVGHVTTQLARLGLAPPLADITRMLEAAGLARSSADADQAVVVRPAYRQDPR